MTTMLEKQTHLFDLQYGGNLVPYLRSRVVLLGLQDGLKASLANPDWISTLFHRISVVSTGLKSLGFPLRLGSLCNLRGIKARSDCSSWKIARSYHLHGVWGCVRNHPCSLCSARTICGLWHFVADSKS